MEVKRTDFIEALAKAKRFTTTKGFAILSNVKVDGPGQMLIATDFNTRIEIPLVIKDFLTKVKPELPEDLAGEVKGLKIPELRDLCTYASLETEGKKDDLITRFMAAAEADAEAKSVEVPEVFCGSPKQMLDIARTLKEDDLVIELQEFVIPEEGLFGAEDVKVCAIAMGSNFQQLPIQSAEGYPDESTFATGAFVAELKGSDLSVVTVVTRTDDNAKDYQKVVVFDGEHNNIVTTDGSRLHCQAVTLDTTEKIIVSTEAIKKIVAIAKDEKITMEIGPDKLVAFRFNGVSVYVRSEPDMEFPDYMALLSKDPDHTLGINPKELLKPFRQCQLVNSGTYTAVRLTFNGGIHVEGESSSGVYQNFEVPVVKGKVEPAVMKTMNIEYLIDALAAMSEKGEIRFRSDEEHPLCLIDAGFQAVVMPTKM